MAENQMGFRADAAPPMKPMAAAEDRAQAALERAREIQAGFTGLGDEFAHDLSKTSL